MENKRTTKPKDSQQLTPDQQPTRATERDRLEVELQDRLSKLNDQARIFIPLIALCLIVAIPIWSKSLTRFVVLLMSPFVLLPLGFCIVHLALAWRGISQVRTRVRDLDRRTKGTDRSE